MTQSTSIVSLHKSFSNKGPKHARPILQDAGANLHIFFIKPYSLVLLQLRFPSRVLRVKAESAEEAEQWEAALQRANMLKVLSLTASDARNIKSLTFPRVRQG